MATKVAGQVAGSEGQEEVRAAAMWASVGVSVVLGRSNVYVTGAPGKANRRGRWRRLSRKSALRGQAERRALRPCRSSSSPARTLPLILGASTLALARLLLSFLLNLLAMHKSGMNLSLVHCRGRQQC